MFIYLITFLLFASTNDANTMYQKADYDGALKAYLSIYDKNDASLNYNIANSYFKLEKYGLAKAYYLKTLRLLPRDTDARYNLELVNTKLGINTNENLFNKYIKFISLNELAILNLILFLLLSIFIYFIIKKYLNKKSISTLTFISLNLLIIFIFSLLITLISYNNYKHKSIIVINETTLLAAPSSSSTELLKLGEGFSLTEKNCEESWCKVVFEDKYIGWVNKENILEI